MIPLLSSLIACNVNPAVLRAAPVFVEGVVVEEGTTTGIAGIEVSFNGGSGSDAINDTVLTETDGTFLLEADYTWFEGDDSEFDCEPCEVVAVDIDGVEQGEWATVTLPIELEGRFIEAEIDGESTPQRVRDGWEALDLTIELAP